MTKEFYPRNPDGTTNIFRAVKLTLLISLSNMIAIQYYRRIQKEAAENVEKEQNN